MAAEPLPVFSIVGKKNSGKTTLTVALAAELKRRGYRVASVKHGHHAFDIDHPGRDSWRHFNEGETEAVMMVSAGKVALVMREPGGEADPAELIDRFFTGRGYDVVLVEGYKRGPFRKIEIFRRSVHEAPLFDPADPLAGSYLAVVSDQALPGSAVATLPLEEDGSHVGRVADLIEREMQEIRGR
jgi:molybdopterin-guanine dinucleotide biosynthesis protein MobB